MNTVPGPEKILSTLKADHPRLLADAARFEAIRQLVKSDALAGAMWEQTLKQADKIIDEPVIEYDIPDGKRLLSVSRRAADRMFALGLAWQVTGEKKYLDRAWLDMQAAAGFKDWNPSHYLDTAEMTAALAIGYDWLYNGLTDAQRTTIRQAIITHGLTPGIACYEGREKFGWWPRAVNNWNQVCNGGMVAGALAVADQEPGLAGKIVHHAVRSLPTAMKHFAPDGASVEGPGYWGYAMRYNVLALACLQSSLGSDFGLSQIEGFDRAANFYIQMRCATGKSFNFADGKPASIDHPALYWLAARFNQPAWATYQARFGTHSPTSLLWYDPKLVEGDKLDLPLVAKFAGLEVACARTSWLDPQALYVGLKSGRNGVSHGHLDLGSIIFEAAGERWLIDMGADDYNLPEFFGKLRNSYYRIRAEGHNTLVINPGRAQPDQDEKALCKISRATGDGQQSIIATDLTAAYAGHGAQRVVRTVTLTDSQLTVHDQVQIKEPGEIWSFFHTTAQITLAPDGRSATLSLDGKQLIARILSPAGAKLSVLDARPLPSSPDPEGQNPNNGAKLLNSSRGHGLVRTGEIPQWGEPDPTKAIRKLAIHLMDVTEVDMSVSFSIADAP